MRIRKSDGDLFKSHWDKFAALGGLALLVLVALFLFVLDSGASSESASGSGPRVRDKAAECNNEALTAIFGRVESPGRLDEVSDTKKSFLASEFRVSCSAPEGSEKKGCGRPIPATADVCPYESCGVKQTKEIKAVLDTDGDGLTDEYEKAHGLDPALADADTDKDGDGFTNMEEFVAKTNPSDATSHPGYLASITLSAPLKQEFSTLQFVGVTPLPGKKYRYAFKQPGRANEYDRGNYFALDGEEVGKSGFVVVRYEQKTAQKTLAGGMKLTQDVSEAVLKRKSDGKIVKFVKGAARTDTDVQATLSCARAGVQELQVVEGQKFKLKDSEFTVVKILGKGNGRTNESVMLKCLKTGKERLIESP